MRPGLRSNQNGSGEDDYEPVSPTSSSRHDASYAPISTRRGQSHRARRGGHTGSQAGRRKRTRTNVEPTNADVEPDAHVEILEPDEILLDSGESVARPNLNNYHELGREWGPARADEVLCSLSLPKNNRPSATGVFEAQTLQAAYQLDKTMLCIVLKCSRHVLDEALLEGPLAREPNAYTNYQTYSIPATTTRIPPKGVSEGFEERNVTVGNTWSTYLEDEQKVFSPELFERLCVTTSEAYALTQTPRGIPSLAVPEPDASQVPAQPKSDFTPLSEEEVTLYVPIFKRLVNRQKVSRDLHEGRLWRHSSKSRSQTREQLMKLEISKVVRQLHVLKTQLNIQFHLLLACWNPTTSTTQALFQDEHTSCARWFRMQKKSHLLECFAFEATKAPEHLRASAKEWQPKPLSAAGARQALKRNELTQALNSLITPFLRGGVAGQGDAHPKVANLQEGFAKKTFRGSVKLTFHRTSDSLVNDVMLAKGPSALSNAEVQLWLDDIHSKRYTIMKVNTGTRKDGLTEAEAQLDDEETDLQEELNNSKNEDKAI